MSDEQITFDVAKAYQATKKHFSSYWHLWLLLLIVIFTVHSRSQVSSVPITDQWAESTINNYLQNQVSAQINAQFPNLPESEQQRRIAAGVAELRAAQGPSLEAQKEQISQQYRTAISYTHEGKQYTYLGDIDSYFWLRYSRNIVEKGTICDTRVDGICWDTHAYAPTGRELQPTTHPYIIALVYQLGNAIGFNIPLMQASLITPSFIAILTVLFAYLLGLLLIGKLGGLLAAIFISFNGMYLRRSLGSDTDIYTLLFPLIILSLVVLAIRAKTLRTRLLYASASGLVIGFFRFTWEGGWWNTFNTIIYAYIAFFGYYVVEHFYTHKGWKKPMKVIKSFFAQQLYQKHLQILGVFYLSSFIFMSIFSSVLLSIPVSTTFYQFNRALIGPLLFARFQKAAVNLNIWPNVITTVAEFNSIALEQVPRQLFLRQSLLLYFLAIFGLFLFFALPLVRKKSKTVVISSFIIFTFIFGTSATLAQIPSLIYFGLLTIAALLYFLYSLLLRIKHSDEQKENYFFGLLLLIWFVGTLYASTQGVRFVLLIVPPASLLLAYALQTILGGIKTVLSKLEVKNLVLPLQIVYLCILVLLAGQVIDDSYAVTGGFVPSYNAAWDRSLTKINQESQPDAIINSWWDFGHWFKHTADRGVTLDGATQNGPQLYWLGKLLLTEDERLSRGILRMLSCSENQAFNALLSATHDTPVSVDIIEEIILLDDKEEIAAILSSYGLTPAQVENVTQHSHCDPPEDFLISSNDMISKSGVWGHFGSWDFYKAEIAALKLAGMEKEEIIQNVTNRKLRNTTREEVEQLYNELARLTDERAINSWIAPWPSYAGDVSCTRQVVENQSQMICQNGIAFNLETKECYANTAQGKVNPQRCLYVENGSFVTQYYDEDLLSLNGRLVGVAFRPVNENTWQATLADSVMSTSLFTKTYHYQGEGLKYFDLFSSERSALGAVIYVHKVNWDGKPIEAPQELVVEESEDNTTEESESIEEVEETLIEEIQADEEEILEEEFELTEVVENTTEEQEDNSTLAAEINSNTTENSSLNASLNASE